MSLEPIVKSANRLLVRQKKEWGEILAGIETKNRYEICDDGGEVLAYAAEEGGGLAGILLRNIFGQMRACTIHIADRANSVVARGVKPFRFYFFRMDLFEGDRPIGAVERRFSLLNRKFDVTDAAGKVVATIQSRLFRIWTFKVFDAGGREVGKISKRWGGGLREIFTDADTFGVEFDEGEVDLELRELLLLATFLIDFTCFEQNSANQRGLIQLGGD